MTAEEKYVRDEITKIHPQLVINMRKTCGFNTHKWADDLLSMCVLIFLEKPIEVQLKVIADGKLENYITFVAGLQVRSGSSKFYNDYRKFTNGIREIYPNYSYRDNQMTTFPTPFEDEEDEVMTCIKYHMEKLNPYEKMLIQEKVIEDRTYKDISETYDIPYSSLKTQTKEVLKKLHKLCSHI